MCSNRSYTLARKCDVGSLASEGGFKRTVNCLPTALTACTVSYPCPIFRICWPCFSLYNSRLKLFIFYTYNTLISLASVIVILTFRVSPPLFPLYYVTLFFTLALKLITYERPPFYLLGDAEVMFFVYFRHSTSAHCSPKRQAYILEVIIIFTYLFNATLG